MPTRRLPSRPSLDHLKHQARDLIADHRARLPAACQRIREFHPRFSQATDEVIGAASLTLADAQLAIAREYGFASWARLRAHVGDPDRPDLDRPLHERIDDPAFRHALTLLDDGDVDGLRACLAANPELIRRRISFEGQNYFRNPSLLQFVAENPVRHDGLPPTIVDVTRVILDAGASELRADLDETLRLVCSGRVARECGVQRPLIDLLCARGADPNAAILTTLAHGELDAVAALRARGARLTLAVAAGCGDLDQARRLLAGARASERHIALALAAQHGHADIVRLLLDAGEAPSRYNPVGFHAHSTPLHQAALAGHVDVVRLLVQGGARLDLRDNHYRGTAADWADHAGHSEIAEYLRRGIG